MARIDAAKLCLGEEVSHALLPVASVSRSVQPQSVCARIALRPAALKLYLRSALTKCAARRVFTRREQQSKQSEMAPKKRSPAQLASAQKGTTSSIATAAHEKARAQRRKQHETLRDVNEIATSVCVQSAIASRLSGVRRREAAATQRAAKATAAEAAVVEAARQRAAAEQRAGITQAAHVCTASVPVMCRFDTAYKKSM